MANHNAMAAFLQFIQRGSHIGARDGRNSSSVLVTTSLWRGVVGTAGATVGMSNVSHWQ